MDPTIEAAIIGAGGAIVAGAVAAAVAVFGFRKSSKDNRETLTRTLEAGRQGQFPERLSRAIEQLGSDVLDIRVGGIYALEGIALDSPKHHPTVMEVLTAFIREHSHEFWPPPGPGVTEPEQWTRPDVQAAFTVIGRRSTERDIREIDLWHANLVQTDLRKANLSNTTLDGATFRAAHLEHAVLRGTNLRNAELTNVYLHRADLRGAILEGATFSGGDLTEANLTGAHLTGAFGLPDTVLPEGWQRDGSSGRLKWTAGGPAPQAAGSGPEVQGGLWVGDRRPELSDLTVAVMGDVRHRDLDRLAPAGGGQRGQHHGVLVVGEDVVHVQPERAAGFLGDAAEEAEHLIPAVIVAAERPAALYVPDHVVGEQLGERRQVPLGERFVALASALDIRMLSHGASPARFLTGAAYSRTGTITPVTRPGTARGAMRQRATGLATLAMNSGSPPVLPIAG